jgi:hypothetical protein
MYVKKTKQMGDPFRKHSKVTVQLGDESDAAAERGEAEEWRDALTHPFPRILTLAA